MRRLIAGVCVVWTATVFGAEIKTPTLKDAQLELMLFASELVVVTHLGIVARSLMKKFMLLVCGLLFVSPVARGSEAAREVEMKRNITYVEGKEEDENKHKLDVYIPKDVKSAPVFMFVHGGAWRSGDRGLYPALGQRFARAGVLTIIPSYRLAPKNPYPAQIEDVAAAFAWTVKHVAEYGGDTNRIFIGGQSAGGHLVALLALNESYLAKHGLSAKNIRGVAAVSGVYDFASNDTMASVFGHDKEVRKDASPLAHVKASAPPFLVTYCEKDYVTLPLQAKVFEAALERAGAKAELFFTPKEDHISEVIAMTKEGDPTSEAILKLIRREATKADNVK